MAKRVNRALYSLDFFRHFTTLGLRKRLVFTLVRSHLDYCSTVYWNISGDLKKKLQNNCQIRDWSSKRWPRYSCQASIGLVNHRCATDVFSAIIIYKARRIGQPTYLAELFNTRRLIEFDRGDAFPVLEIPGWTSEAGWKSLVCECSQFWNELPNRKGYMPFLRKFITALYKHLFEIGS